MAPALALLALTLLATATSTTIVHQPHHKHANAGGGKRIRFATGKEDWKELFVAPLPGVSLADYHPQRKSLPADEEPLTYYSWHSHTYFFQSNADATNRTIALRDRFIETFDANNCPHTCDMGPPFDSCGAGVCVWSLNHAPIGPHTMGSWGAFLPNEYLTSVVAWFSANHDDFEVLFHPNTGYPVGDHTSSKRALWLKEQVPLDLTALVATQCATLGCDDTTSAAATF